MLNPRAFHLGIHASHDRMLATEDYDNYMDRFEEGTKPMESDLHKILRLYECLRESPVGVYQYSLADNSTWVNWELFQDLFNGEDVDRKPTSSGGYEYSKLIGDVTIYSYSPAPETITKPSTETIRMEKTEWT